MLTARLRKLELAGVIEPDAGRELQPILLALDGVGRPLRDGQLTVTGGTHPVQATMNSS